MDPHRGSACRLDSAYAKIQAKEASVKVDTVMDTSALTDYISGLSSDSAE